MKKVLNILIPLCLLSTASLVQAEGFYIGFNVGQASYDATLDDFAFLDDGSIISASLEDSDTSISFTFGKQMTPNLAIEGGYVDLGELVLSAVSDGTGSLYFPGPVNLTIGATGLFIDVKGMTQINETTSFYGKLGLLKWDEDASLSDSTGGVSVSEDGNDIFFGFGVSFAISNSALLNIDYTLYTVDSDEVDVDVFSVGIQFKM